MPFEVRRWKREWQVVNTKDGIMASKHPSRKKAKRAKRKLMARPVATQKTFNPAENRVPSGAGPGAGGGRFAPGQVSDRGKPTSSGGSRGGGANAPRAGTGGSGAGPSAPPNAFIRTGHDPSNPSEHEEHQIQNQARGDLAQAHEIEQQVHMLRAQITWDKQQIAFQSGLGPAPATASPGVGRQNTTGAAGNVGSAAAAGATSGAAAQNFSNTPPNPNSAQTQSYIQFLRQDIASLRTQSGQLQHQADQLTDHAHALLASIRGKGQDVPDITISAKALMQLIQSYNNSF